MLSFSPTMKHTRYTIYIVFQQIPLNLNIWYSEQDLIPISLKYWRSTCTFKCMHNTPIYTHTCESSHSRTIQGTESPSGGSENIPAFLSWAGRKRCLFFCYRLFTKEAACTAIAQQDSGMDGWLGVNIQWIQQTSHIKYWSANAKFN